MAKSKQVCESLLNDLKEDLRNHPDLFESICEIVALSRVSKDGKPASFDEIEEALIPKIKQLGQQTLSGFVESVEDAQHEKVKKQRNSVRLREKKR